MLKRATKRLPPPFAKCCFFSALFLLLNTNLTNIAWCEDLDSAKAIAISIVLENDLFTGSDSGYTGGGIISFSEAWQKIDQEDPQKDRVTAFFDGLSLISAADRLRRRPITFGQVMVTPENLRAEQPVLDDVPYAGLLFGRVDYEYRSSHERDKFGLLLGIVGPSARAEETQKMFHKMTDSTEPQGWDNQLHDEPAINIDYEHLWKVSNSPLGDGGYSTDLSTYTGVSLGNIATEIDAGVILRWGLNLPAVPCSVYKGGVGYVPDMGSDREKEWSFFIMAGAEIAYMGYSVFLDGNAWEDDSQSVKRIPEQASFFGGFGVAYERFRLHMFFLRGTDQFREQDSSTQYGSLTLGWIF